MKEVVRIWIVATGLLMGIMLAVFVTAHQTLRQSANDPQIQLAQDWADQIEAGIGVTALFSGPAIDPVHSLAPFGIVYDKEGNIAGSSVTAPTTMLQPPGVLDAVDSAQDKEVRFTWQPASGVRFAAVITKASFDDKTYYVLSARNLREVEDRIMRVLVVDVTASVAGLLFATAIIFPGAFSRKKRT